MATFPKEVIALAQQSQEKYGVPASVTLAQYATESAYGKSWLAQNANNYFGMMASKNSSSKVWRSDRYWQVHDSMADSFDKHGQLLAGPTYSGATAGYTDAYDYIDRMAPIYAPESDGNTGIAALWKQIIKDNNLTQYDTGAAGSVSGSGSSGSSGLSGSGGVVVSGGGSGGGLREALIALLSALIKGGAVAAVVILGGVFFMQAFDLKLPKAGGGKK